jgi:hypothetical protein
MLRGSITLISPHVDDIAAAIDQCVEAANRNIPQNHLPRDPARRQRAATQASTTPEGFVSLIRTPHPPVSQVIVAW